MLCIWNYSCANIHNLDFTVDWLMYFENNNKNIFYRNWLVASPKALIVIAHGLGEHSGRYEKIATQFNQEGFSVYALDHQGHGQSDGSKGHIDAFTDYHSDLYQLVNLAKEENSGLKSYLLGHSMGGLIATGYVLRKPDFDGVIISAPAYGVPGMAANIQLKIGALLGRLLPNQALANKIDAKYVCSSEAVVRAYIDDPLVHDQITLGWGKALLDEQKYVHNHLTNMTIPLLMLVPQADKLTDHTVTEKWFEIIPAHKEIHCYPDSYHEVLNEEIEGAQAMSTMLEWLRQNI